MVEWLPIGQAPKDGSPFFALTRLGFRKVARWVGYRKEWWEQVDGNTKKRVVEESGAFETTDGDDDSCNLTHFLSEEPESPYAQCPQCNGRGSTHLAYDGKARTPEEQYEYEAKIAGIGEFLCPVCKGDKTVLRRD